MGGTASSDFRGIRGTGGTAGMGGTGGIDGVKTGAAGDANGTATAAAVGAAVVASSATAAGSACSVGGEAGMNSNFSSSRWASSGDSLAGSTHLAFLAFPLKMKNLGGLGGMADALRDAFSSDTRRETLNSASSSEAAGRSCRNDFCERTAVLNGVRVASMQ